jgi:hypothetical protein
LVALAVAAFVFLSVAPAASAAAQGKPDTGKVVGTWYIEIYAGEQTFTLKLVVTETQGQLAGTISESMGTFTDVAISEIFYDGANFRFSFVSPTPPDGLSRTVKADFKVGDGTMTGTIEVPDLGFMADAKATRAAQ